MQLGFCPTVKEKAVSTLYWYRSCCAFGISSWHSGTIFNHSKKFQEGSLFEFKEIWLIVLNLSEQLCRLKQSPVSRRKQKATSLMKLLATNFSFDSLIRTLILLCQPSHLLVLYMTSSVIIEDFNTAATVLNQIHPTT